ncbi:heparinase [Pedobacter sp. Leaf216]|uniref:DUF4962 domain-containing protein n=1 Tax=Pedobacter sp. Leaf216 TaxID=1735684 RepID=UPI0006FAE382|nr:DUF4962 domain-containing protein [Pedobacter sp. Leaf216]KQM77167.1 heparinase [Pedobacter sp. Leaf216]
MKKIFTLTLSLLSLHIFAQQQPGVIKLTAEKLHSRVREWPYPAHGIIVPTNAPALLWPGTNGKNMVKPMESGSEVPEDPNIGNVRYKVLLASDKDFKNNLTESAEQRWAVYPLHKALKAGKWYWKYGYALKNTGKWAWSPVYNFVVDAKYANQKVSPAVSEVLKRNQGSHPLLWDMNRNGEAFYRNNLQNPEAKKFIAFAEKLMKEPLPVEKPQRIIDTTGKNDREKKIIIERMYHGFGDAVGTPVRNLCIAYQLTKDKRFILDAKRRALNIAKMNPNGLATGDDFTSGAVLEALGWFYDAGYTVLNAEEKELFKNIITIRARRVYDHLPNRFELHVSDNHVWQITLRNLAIATVSVINEVPEAKEWLTYMYEVWSARFPVLGTTDGGWHEGNGYFRVNFKSIIYLSQMFGDFSGVDYFKLPWMQNLPYYMLYTHPNGSASTAIGDMWENIPTVVKGEAWFADALIFKMNNQYLNWYVSKIKNDNPDYFHGTDDYLLFRLLNYKPNQQVSTLSPAKLPKSRNFADVGVVAMHEDLANANKSLSSYLFSSPFGSSGHGHASQNAFTINYKGKVLFGGSGYYSNFSDKHNLLYYRTSKAYNTILADSLNQKIGEEGYGWIARAITGNHIQYALGDASNAYGEIKSDFWLDRFKQINVIPNKANGYGESGVSLYRRHMLQLAGGYIVLYDELEANKPVKWTTQFHAPYYTIEALQHNNSNQQCFALKTDLGNVNATVFANSALQLNVHNKFYEAAVNWNKVTNDEGKIKDFVDQWHAGITSIPAQKFRFLTLIQVKDGKTEVIKTISSANGLYHMQVGDWDIQAQLDGNKKASLQISDKKVGSLFNYGDLPITFNGKTFKPALSGSSTLLELNGTKLNKQEVVDKLPDVAVYDRE